MSSAFEKTEDEDDDRNDCEEGEPPGSARRDGPASPDRGTHSSPPIILELELELELVSIRLLSFFSNLHAFTPLVLLTPDS
jgi:hypothetical protein